MTEITTGYTTFTGSDDAKWDNANKWRCYRIKRMFFDQISVALKLKFYTEKRR